MSFVDPIDRTQLALTTKKWVETYEATEALPCLATNEDQQRWWGKLLADAQDALRVLEEERINLTRPILESKRGVDSAFGEVAKVVERFKNLAKTKLATAREELAALQTTQRELAATHAAAGDSAAVLAAVAAIPEDISVPGAGGGWAWTFEVVDPKAVPADYLVVDEKKLSAYAKAFKKSENIPGIPGVVFRRVAKVIAGRV